MLAATPGTRLSEVADIPHTLERPVARTGELPGTPSVSLMAGMEAAPTIRPPAGTGNRSRIRREIFLYDDGIVLSLTMRALEQLGILEASLRERAPLTQLYPELTERGFGYLRVALRTLAGQGWLPTEPSLDPGDTFLDWTASGLTAADQRHRYVALGDFLALFGAGDPDPWSQPWPEQAAARFPELLDSRTGGVAGSDGADAMMRTHLDGGLAVPAMLSLWGTGRLGDAGPALSGSGLDVAIGSLLSSLGWLDATGAWTDLGRTASEYTVHFGIVGSYLPLLARLPDVYRGELTVATRDADTAEWHVNRELNVIASAAAHRRYFADADGIFLELFDREPVSEQPRFIADMGCGDGSWLSHLYELISTRTLRGRHLESNPLLMVGIDYNEAALDQASEHLGERDIPSLVVFGDVGDPDGLRASLAEHGLAIEDGLHIRSFLDHDRAYTGGETTEVVPGSSSGAFVDPGGRPLAPEEVERDLVSHLRRWAPHLRRHGLVVLEAHSVSPAVTRRHLGALHSVAFDAYHAYSHQYPIEHSAFLSCCSAAGLERVSLAERQYPSSRPFTTVSLNRFLIRESDSVLPAVRGDGLREDSWSPAPGTDLADGSRLHELLFTDGDLARPRRWCAPATGFVVAGALAGIEERLAEAGPGDSIRVLDYGAGTGLATIELLKACRERGIEERLERCGARLEIHLADLPSSWFAQGFELLSDCEWTRFHSLRDDEGAFRPLQEVLGGRSVDLVMANMVFHLIPVSALGRVAAEIAEVLVPGGRFLWSSPDLGPPGPHAVLFHDPNRALRSLWLELLAGDGEAAAGVGEGSEPLPAAADSAVRRARESASGADARSAGERAKRRILPDANLAEDVEGALAEVLTGRTERPTYEILDQEVVDVLLVPSNGAEYLPEIEDRGARKELIRSLMRARVLPEMRRGPAGTAVGLNVQWTLGDFRKPTRG